jgi:subtilisin family serine protease
VDTLQQIGEVATAWPMTEIKLAPIIPEVTFSNDAAAANYSVHAYTGVEQAHKDGILGKGVTIAVVDTGISYDHPAVRHEFCPCAVSR